MDKHIVDIITDNYVRKYGIDDFNAKKNKEQTDACFKNTLKVYYELQKRLDVHSIHNHIVSSTLLIPENSRSEKLAEMNREFMKIKTNLHPNNYIYREFDTYTYRIKNGFIQWHDIDNKVIAKAVCIPIAVCQNTISEFKHHDIYFKYIRILWSWREDFIEEWEEMSSHRDILKEIKKIKKLVKKYKNPKLTCSGLVYSNLIANYRDISLTHCFIYSIWIMQRLNYTHVICNIAKDEIANAFYIIKDIEKY